MKKKLFRNASLVALSAVMVCGTAFGLAGCDGSSTNTISISMFCGNDDRAINEAACNTWAAEYTQQMIADGTWEEGHEPIKIRFSSNADTTAYFDALNQQMASNSQPDIFYVSPKYVRAWSSSGRILDLTEYLLEDAETLADVWDDSLSFYAYSADESYSRGEGVYYNEEAGAYYSVESNVEVGLYALPKDFSNFGLSFNNFFFSEEHRDALMSMTTQDRTGVSGAQSESAIQVYNGESGVVTYADGSGDAPLIVPGVPITYKPYNFYRFPSYQAAITGGDPMAWMVQTYTGGKGYTVTIPGFPGDTFEDAKEYWPDGENTDVTIPEGMQNPDADYDPTQGYITYTYAEYSALTWAVTYYFNTYDWEGSGVGGVTTSDGATRANVYGNDQYDSTLYFLPWLAGNNATYLNADSTSVVNPTGTDTITETQVTLSGAEEEVAVQYGSNSEAFIETLGAFYAYGSDWNGNSNNAGDTYNEKSSGWNLFLAGQQLFYGMGTWNGIETNKTPREYLEVNLMPEPVSEDYALYSYIKDADYEMKEYGTKKDSYTGQEIFKNQLERQDKWGARMDSVGYGVSATAATEADWKAAACADLVKYLTISEEMQATLTYSGSQLPNFKSMCVDFMNKEGDYFSQMITPDDGAKFDEAYALARDMYSAAQAGGTGTIGEWLADKTIDGQPAVFDPQFESGSLGDVDSIAYAMKVLYITAYNYADRDLSLRMQFGLNFVRDSAMYTYNDSWVVEFDPRGDNQVMAYRMQEPLSNMADVISAMLTSDKLKSNPDLTPVQNQRYATPAWWALHQTDRSQELLDDAIQRENNLIR